MVEPPFKLIIYEHDNRDEIVKKSLEKTLQNYEHLITKIGEAKGCGGNPRYDLILDEGIRAYLSGEVDKRKNR